MTSEENKVLLEYSRNNWEILALCFIVIIGILLVYIAISNPGGKEGLEGIWLHNYNSSGVCGNIKEHGKGDWVCVNIRDMSFERALEVCQHEVGHELFSETCENNITKCIGMDE